jgi:hypothetical protein
MFLLPLIHKFFEGKSNFTLFVSLPAVPANNIESPLSFFDARSLNTRFVTPVSYEETGYSGPSAES